MWLLFVFISTIICGCLDIIEKKGSKDQPLHYWTFANLTYGVISIITAIIMMPRIMSSAFDLKVFFLVFPVSLLSTIGYYFTVKAFSCSDVSLVSPIFRLRIVWILILSTIFLKDDRLTIIQILIIFILLILSILLNKNNKTRKSKKGILYALGYLFANGTASFINKVVVNIVQD